MYELFSSTLMSFILCFCERHLLLFDLHLPLLWVSSSALVSVFLLFFELHLYKFSSKWNSNFGKTKLWEILKNTRLLNLNTSVYSWNVNIGCQHKESFGGLLLEGRIWFFFSTISRVSNSKLFPEIQKNVLPTIGSIFFIFEHKFDVCKMVKSNLN